MEFVRRELPCARSCAAAAVVLVNACLLLQGVAGGIMSILPVCCEAGSPQALRLAAAAVDSFADIVDCVGFTVSSSRVRPPRRGTRPAPAR